MCLVLIEPGTYDYLNSSWARNHDSPIFHPGEYNTDLVAEKAYGFLEDAHKAGSPFMMTIAPIAPHAHQNSTLTGDIFFMPPIPAERHKHMFQNVTVPRTANFNPDVVGNRFSKDFTSRADTVISSLVVWAGLVGCLNKMPKMSTTMMNIIVFAFEVSKP